MCIRDSYTRLQCTHFKSTIKTVACSRLFAIVKWLRPPIKHFSRLQSKHTGTEMVLSVKLAIHYAYDNLSELNISKCANIQIMKKKTEINKNKKPKTQKNKEMGIKI